MTAKEYIEREATQNEIKKLCDKYNLAYGEQYGGFAEKIANITNTIPAADVQEVRHGDWIAVDTTSYKNSEEGTERRYYVCSLCSIKNAIRSKYCPNCGAKMNKE